MQLKYINHDGSKVAFQLSERPIIIGRNPEADLVINDHRASRIHCGLRYLDGAFHIKDLKSKNGTFVNNQRIEYAELKPGDRIQIGSIAFTLEPNPKTNHPEIAVNELKNEMEHGGKGYETILKEIVDSTTDQERDKKTGTACVSQK